MTIAEVPPEARAAVLARRRKEMVELDYRRELRRLDQHGYSQREIAKWLGIAQPSVLSALRTAAKVTMPLDGFSGATPYEICQRYAADFIDRAKLVDELTRFPYVKGVQTDGYDSLIVDPDGTWSEVGDAVRRGLIEDEVCEEVCNRRHGIAVARAEHADT
ncbi:helix-turn-helix domain-containing protein [Microbacterium sp. YJN-G]|uniref:helix-turn-helix domain-containing protein n=1 Tax=Microbacterium sp. YJN-G TaxID=2763257 RepID=UPI001D0C8953|nr:helix-turn-helix domain-containing protein [Microbacterium sp. YJN-G]